MEAQLLSQLVLLLGQRSERRAHLQELVGLVPDQVRQQLHNVGGLRTWLAGFPSLLAVHGDIVELRLPAAESSEAASEGAANSSSGSEGARASTRAATTDKGSDEAAERDSTSSRGDLNDELERGVLLRGLPFQATIHDVAAFLGPLASRLQAAFPDVDGCLTEAIDILINKSGRPSGFARVQFDSPDAAAAACAKLHKRTLTIAGHQGSGARARYVEVFRAYDMEALYLRPKNGAAPAKKAAGAAAAGGEAPRRSTTAATRQGKTSPAAAPATAAPPASRASSKRGGGKVGGATRSMELRGPTLWLRGLPANTSEQDVLALLAAYDLVDTVDDATNPVNFVTEYGGPTLSKLAIVDMRSSEDAAAATKALSDHWLRTQNIEVSDGSTHRAPSKQDCSPSDAAVPSSPRPTRLSEQTRALRALISPGARVAKVPSVGFGCGPSPPGQAMFGMGLHGRFDIQAI
eukprot:TRINITY_DN19589_c0_g1_i1.p1 TRINITY_DN19589_c0_g1~~TRINITY_DN19589_c0_g1_i1.p1  ORF type:complete len:496 (-),score=119.38 TRINITY_DN19589_c0_g1_i1:170-1558(-)